MNLPPDCAADSIAGPPARASRTGRFFWLLCALVLSILVVLALPNQRISLGASQLQGLVGSYTGHGSWEIVVSNTGTVHWTPSAPDMAYVRETVNGVDIDPKADVDLSPIAATVSEAGGASRDISARIELEAAKPGSASSSLSLSNASIQYTFHWMPSADYPNEPAPKKLVYYYRRRVTLSGGSTSTPDQVTMTDSANGTIGSIGDTISHTATGPYGQDSSSHPTHSDDPFVRQEEDMSIGPNMTSPSFTKQFSISGVATAGMEVDRASVSNTDATATFSLGVDLCVSGFDMGRFGGSLAPASGGHNSGSTDPTFTRWLPLAFSPQMSSQPFRYQAGALPAPWGNINCMYSPALRQEPANPNSDENGFANEYMP